MNRRQFVQTMLPALLPASAQQPRRSPNVVLILIDDLGWMDLGCQGSTFYETPELDRLAREGTRFTDAYANCPVCSPTRAALMTGRYPARIGFTGHITATGQHRYPPHSRIIPPRDRLYLRSEEITIAEALKPAGYVSASIGKWHLGSKEYFPEKQGFDVNVAGYEHGSPPSYFSPYKNPKLAWNPEIPTLGEGRPGEYLTDRLTDEAVRFIEANRQRPFFLYLPHYAVHTPLEAPAVLIDKYRAKLERDRSQTDPVYAAMVEAVDRGVGRIMAALRRLSLDENTLVIVTSDNGGESKSTSNAPLRAGKGCLYEGGIRVPLIVRWPGRVRAAARSQTPVMTADLYATLLDYAGVAPPNVPLDGTSLRPVLEGGSLGPRDLFWYYPHYSGQYQQPGAAMRSGRWKLVELYDPPRVELYDLAVDPGEKSDLSSKHPQTVAEMRRRLREWLESVRAVLHTPNPAYVPTA